MTQRGLVCLLLGALSWGQAAKPSVPASSKPAAPAATHPATTPSGGADEQAPAKAESNVAPDAAVITIPGSCDKPAADPNSADCKTVVTRAQFDKLMATVAPNAPPQARRQIASRYAQMIVMSSDAQKMGLDKSDKFAEMMKLQRMQVLAQMLQQDMQEKAGQIPDKDIEDYYNANKSTFEEASLQRLFVPKNKQLDPPKEPLSDEATKKRQEESEAAMQKEAEALQKRAAAGEDFAKLEQEAFQFAGMKAQAPNSSMPNMRLTSLPLAHRSVFDMKAGEVSPVIADGAGLFVYKMGEKQTLPVDKVKDEIKNQLRAQRLNDEMTKLQQSAQPTLNDDYFGPAPSAGEEGAGVEQHGKSGVTVGTKPAPKPAPPNPKPN